MSTRCMIGYTENGKTATASYCHSDGYPWRTGLLLFGYKTLDEVKELVDMGAMRHVGLFSTGTRGGDPDDLYARSDNGWDWLFYANRTVYYDDVPEYPISGAIADVMHEESYAYLFKNGKWWVYGSEGHPDWQLLSHALVHGIRRDIEVEIPQMAGICQEYFKFRPMLNKKASWFTKTADDRLQHISQSLLSLYSVTCFDNISYDEYYTRAKHSGVPVKYQNRIQAVDWATEIALIQNRAGNVLKIAVSELVKYITFGIPEYSVSNPAVLKPWKGWA